MQKTVGELLSSARQWSGVYCIGVAGDAAAHAMVRLVTLIGIYCNSSEQHYILRPYHQIVLLVSRSHRGAAINNW